MSDKRSGSARRRLVPYGLMGPGLIWLALFFVLPMFYMGELALRSGTLETGFVVHLGVLELLATRSRATTSSSSAR